MNRSEPDLNRRDALGKGLAAILTVATASDAVARGLPDPDGAGLGSSGSKTIEVGDLERMNPDLEGDEFGMPGPSKGKDKSKKDKSKKDKSKKDKSKKDKSKKDKSKKDKSKKDKSNGHSVSTGW